MDNYTWEVTGQVPDQVFDNQGNVTTGKTISFTISPQGYSGTIFVPDATYKNLDSVRTMIQAEVDAIVAVHGLSG